METRAHHILIGTFVTLAVAAIMLFALWLHKSYGDGAVKHYEVVFNETVRGLSQGSAVEYSGIVVGDVASLRLDPNDPRRVLARIAIKSSIPVRKDTTAVLALTGLTGTSVIQLGGGSPGSPLLEGSNGQDPVIVASPSPFARILNSGENTVANINDLLRNANRVFSEENVNNVSKILANVEEVSNTMAQQSGHVSSMLDALAEAGKGADQALAQISQLARTAEKAVGERGAAIMDNVRNTTESLSRISAETENLLANHYGALANGMQGLSDIGPAIRELRSTLVTLRTLIQRLNEDPAGYLLGRDTIREFKP